MFRQRMAHRSRKSRSLTVICIWSNLATCPSCTVSCSIHFQLCSQLVILRQSEAMTKWTTGRGDSLWINAVERYTPLTHENGSGRYTLRSCMNTLAMKVDLVPESTISLMRAYLGMGTLRPHCIKLRASLARYSSGVHSTPARKRTARKTLVTL
ncbi:hypothetical protein NEOLEDRAFT_529078 [Neolentinus lepideus HHB14362 ss-1]|uniref:Uncharacterized protein n=1 Tax=Neolentinus lepideus HHB14362 ss-1 TaxID=1314782 RepID=A0A165REW2_9AGAM|nr:hypothetical protein NEOLEDRAFT_529078 [Neolentinus lepideus HHB14362 ss-1]